ncbi:MFS transporter [Niveispirillum sp. KHB5.9]|uniref:MFS transporter n=1 Tax=Niveispirillum sp. KHB5.9 TaxID=3400269 RepID=UPI003A88642D
MAEPRPTRDLPPPLLASALYAVGSGLFHTLLPLRLAADGHGTAEIGLVVTGYSGGFLLGCLLSERLIVMVGHVRACAAFCAAAAVAVLGFDWPLPLPLMIGLQIVGGCSAAALATVTESWLNELVRPAWRGRLLTIYVILLSLCWGLGQVIAIWVPPTGSRLLILAALFHALSLVPIVALKVESPPVPAPVRLQWLRAWRVSPVGVMCCLYTGLVAGTFAGIGPLYGATVGFGQQQIVILMAVMQIGGLVLQWPVGSLSDRFDRRFIMLGMAVAMAAVAIAFLGVGPATPFWIACFLFAGLGGLSDAFYPVGVAHTNDRAQAGEYVALSSNLLLIWAAGRTAGPMIGTGTLAAGGGDGFFLYVLALSLLLGLYVAWRLIRRRQNRLREEFVAYPQTSPILFQWSPHKPLEPANDQPKGPQT